jgi:hypothetical protein
LTLMTFTVLLLRYRAILLLGGGAPLVLPGPGIAAAEAAAKRATIELAPLLARFRGLFVRAGGGRLGAAALPG